MHAVQVSSPDGNSWQIGNETICMSPEGSFEMCAQDPVLTAMSPEGKYAICICMHSCPDVMLLMFLSFWQNDGIHILYNYCMREHMHITPPPYPPTPHTHTQNS